MASPTATAHASLSPVTSTEADDEPRSRAPSARFRARSRHDAPTLTPEDLDSFLQRRLSARLAIDLHLTASGDDPLATNADTGIRRKAPPPSRRSVPTTPSRRTRKPAFVLHVIRRATTRLFVAHRRDVLALLTLSCAIATVLFLSSSTFAPHGRDRATPPRATPITTTTTTAASTTPVPAASLAAAPPPASTAAPPLPRRLSTPPRARGTNAASKMARPSLPAPSAVPSASPAAAPDDAVESARRDLLHAKNELAATL